MTSLVVPQIEIDRFINLILEQFNQQHGLIGDEKMVREDMEYEFISPREGFHNGIQLTTIDTNDYFVIKVYYRFRFDYQARFAEFRLEANENTGAGPGNTVYVSLALLPYSLFPTISKLVAEGSLDTDICYTKLILNNNLSGFINTNNGSKSLVLDDNLFSVTLDWDASSANCGAIYDTRLTATNQLEPEIQDGVNILDFTTYTFVSVLHTQTQEPLISDVRELWVTSFNINDTFGAIEDPTVLPRNWYNLSHNSDGSYTAKMRYRIYESPGNSEVSNFINYSLIPYTNTDPKNAKMPLYSPVPILNNFDAGPWYCQKCGVGYIATVDSSNNLSILRTKNYKVKTLVLLRICEDIDNFPGYIVIRGSKISNMKDHIDYEKTQEEDSYLYNEHMCPKDIIGAEIVLHYKDFDPHGIFEHVETIQMPDNYSGVIDPKKMFKKYSEFSHKS